MNYLYIIYLNIYMYMNVFETMSIRWDGTKEEKGSKSAMFLQCSGEWKCEYYCSFWKRFDRSNRWKWLENLDPLVLELGVHIDIKPFWIVFRLDMPFECTYYNETAITNYIYYIHQRRLKVIVECQIDTQHYTLNSQRMH